jgi:hypothetical protein
MTTADAAEERVQRRYRNSAAHAPGGASRFPQPHRRGGQRGQNGRVGGTLTGRHVWQLPGDPDWSQPERHPFAEA